MRWLPFGSRHRSQHGPLMVTAIPALCGHVGHVRHRRPTSPPVVHYSLTVSAPGVQSWFRPLTRHRRTRWTDASPSGSAAGGCITGTFRLSQRLMTSNASLTSRSPQGAASKSTSGRPLCPLLGRQAGRGIHLDLHIYARAALAAPLTRWRPGSAGASTSRGRSPARRGGWRRAE